MRFPRQEYWSGLPFPSPGDLPDLVIEPASPALADGVFTAEPSGKPPVTVEGLKKGCKANHKNACIHHSWKKTGRGNKRYIHVPFITTSASVQLVSCVRLFVTPWSAACQASLSITNSGVYSNSCPLSWWCHPIISSSLVPSSSCPQSFPASGSFQMSQLFASGDQSIGVSASESVFPKNTQDWTPLGWIGWIALQSPWLSRVFSNTTVQRHQFFGTQLSLQSSSHIHTWLLEKP